MKKFSWIMALLAALTVVFVGVGCGGGDTPPEGTYEEIWRLTEALEDVAVADFAGDASGTAAAKLVLNAIGIDLAGDPPVSVVANGEVKALTASTYTATWGAGIDLMHSVLAFKKNDKITVTGKVLEGTPSGATEGIFVTATAGAGESEGFAKLTEGAFEVELILSGAKYSSATSAGGDSPAAVRIGAKPAGIKFQVTEVVIERLEETGEGGGVADLAVTFGATATQVKIEDSGEIASLTYIAGPPTGYTVTYGTDGYEWGVLRFELDLGTTKLEDYEMVTFTYTGIAGDYNYKNAYLLASKTEADLTPYKAAAALQPLVVSKYKGGGAAWHEGEGPQVSGTTGSPVALELSNLNATSKAYTGKVWFAIFMGMAKEDGEEVATSYSVTDVKFVGK